MQKTHTAVLNSVLQVWVVALSNNIFTKQSFILWFTICTLTSSFINEHIFMCTVVETFFVVDKTTMVIGDFSEQILMLIISMQ